MARPAVLSPGKLTAAGIAVVGRHGLEGLTMRAVAAELGTSATALYRHVADRDGLLDLILEHIAAGLRVRIDAPTPRERLETRLARAHAYMADHRWVLHILIQGERVAVAALPFSDACLGDLLDAGLSLPDARKANRAVWRFLIGDLLDAPLTAAGSQRARVLAAAADDPALPHFARLVRAELPIDPVADFRFGLAALLDGLLAQPPLGSTR